jgi:hypothetical protein
MWNWEVFLKSVDTFQFRLEMDNNNYGQFPFASQCISSVNREIFIGDKYFLRTLYKDERPFWDIVPCSLVGVDRRVRGVDCLPQGDGAGRTSETSVYFNDTTRLYIPEGSHLLTRRRENLKSHERCTDKWNSILMPIYIFLNLAVSVTIIRLLCTCNTTGFV